MNQIATLWWSFRDVIWPRRFYNNNVKDKISGLKGFFPDLRRSFYSRDRGARWKVGGLTIENNFL